MGHKWLGWVNRNCWSQRQRPCLCGTVSWISPCGGVNHLLRALESMANKSYWYFSHLSWIISSPYYLTLLFCQSCPSFFSGKLTDIIHFKLRTAVNVGLYSFKIDFCNVSLLKILACYMIYTIIICIYSCEQTHTLHNKFNPVVVVTWFGLWWR